MGVVLEGPSLTAETYAGLTRQRVSHTLGMPLRHGRNKRKGAHRAPFVDTAADQLIGTFLPSLYWYSVIDGFFSSPSASKPIFAVTP